MNRTREDEVCVCFHVPLSKLVKHYRLCHPRVPSQFSECYGAGTGCGWCVPFLARLFEQLEQGQQPELGMSMDEYRQRRKRFHQTGRRELPGNDTGGPFPGDDGGVV